MQFSEKLQRLMAQHGLTQEALAATLGVSQRAISGWLNGSRPQVSKIKQLAHYFGVPIDIIIDDTVRFTETDTSILEPDQPPSPAQAFFYRVLLLAERKGVSVNHLCTLIGISRTMLYDIKNGHVPLSENMRRKLSDAEAPTCAPSLGFSSAKRAALIREVHAIELEQRALAARLSKVVETLLTYHT